MLEEHNQKRMDKSIKRTLSQSALGYKSVIRTIASWN